MYLNLKFSTFVSYPSFCEFNVQQKQIKRLALLCQYFQRVFWCIIAIIPSPDILTRWLDNWSFFIGKAQFKQYTTQCGTKATVQWLEYQQQRRRDPFSILQLTWAVVCALLFTDVVLHCSHDSNTIALWKHSFQRVLLHIRRTQTCSCILTQCNNIIHNISTHYLYCVLIQPCTTKTYLTTTIYFILFIYYSFSEQRFYTLWKFSSIIHNL